MEQIAIENAHDARGLRGITAIELPSATDSAWQLRSHALWRTLYPSSAPAPFVHEQKEDEKSNAHEPSRALISLPQRSPASTNVLSSSTTLSTSKRSREEDSIISIDPNHLRERHELTLREELIPTSHAKHRIVHPPFKIKKVLAGHQGWVWCVAVDPTNSWFATGSADTIIKVWDLSSGELKLNLTGHKEGVRGIAISRHTTYMYSAGDDHAVKCWDLERNEITRDFHGHKSAVHAVASHPSLDLILSAGRDKTVRVWDLRTRAAVHILEGHTDSVMTLAAQELDPQLISGGNDGMIFLWDIGMGKPITRLTRHKKPVRGLTISRKDSALISCAADNIRLWHLRNDYAFIANARIQPISDALHQKKKSKSAPLPESSYRWSCCSMSVRNILAVGSQDGNLALYDWNRDQNSLQDKQHQGGQLGSYDFRSYMDPFQLTRTKSLRGTLAGEGGINAVCFDHSGTKLITAESDKTVKIWTIENKK